MKKQCERCGKQTESTYVVRSTLTKKRKVCWDCKYSIERFIKNNYKIQDDDVPPIRYDVISINGEKYIREDLI